MALVFKDRVKETSTTTGTGTYTLAGAVAGFQSFSAIGNANTCYYVATDGTDWEVGIGTYTSSGTTLARTSVLTSTNANAAVNWAAGTRTIFVDVAAALVSVLARTDQGNTFSGNQVMQALLDLSAASAGQISFPASQNASAGANTLDDYEEGTFTPSFSATSATFNYGATRSGSYTKVGSLVSFVAAISLATTGNTLNANALSLTGLPFTNTGTPGGNVYCDVSWQNSTTSYILVQGSIGSTSISFLGTTAAATSVSTTSLANNALLHATNGSKIIVWGTYQAT